MSRVLKTDIPGRDFRVDLEVVRESGWEAVFAPDLDPPLELVVDIGFGRGEFLMDLACDSPGVAHIGIERSYKRVHKMVRRVAKTPLLNLRIVEGFAQDLIFGHFEAASVSRFWINFPDPWPKERHARRRLIRSDLVHELAGKLVAGGELRFATDDVLYAEQAIEVLSAEPLLENVHAPEPYLREAPGRPPTAFELEWLAAGKPLHFFSYRRNACQAKLGPRSGRSPSESQ